MQLFRIAREIYSRDLSGLGASIAGGRWNPRGAAVLYTSESRALATLEYLVHVPLALLPADLSITTLEVQDDTELETITPKHLLPSWRMYPAPPELADLGAKWLRHGRILLLRVPSVIVDEEYNVLVNPSHPAMAGVHITDIRPFSLDPRLGK